jgi:hypothetical protein
LSHNTVKNGKGWPTLCYEEVQATEGDPVILNVNFEELRALAAGMDIVLGAVHADAHGGVAAPTEAMAHAEALRPRLTGDLSIATLAEQRRVRSAVALVSENLRERLEDTVIQHSPGHEEAVFLYFDYGHTLTVLDKLDRMGEKMQAMIEVMTGECVSAHSLVEINFPD